MIMTKHQTLLPLIILLFFFISCSKNDPPEPGARKAVIHDYTGLDGCGWVIRLDEGETLEPTNLQSFGIKLKEGKKVWITYTELNDLASICMVGPIVRIDGIWAR
jgi:hypothetical protein